MLTQATSLKQTGNRFYAKCEFKRAIEAYKKALQELREKESEDLQLTAILNSNLSSCYMETGMYEQAISSLDTALKIIDNMLEIDAFDTKTQKLKVKCLFRLARCLFYCGDSLKAKENAEKLLRDIEDDNEWKAKTESFLQDLSNQATNIGNKPLRKIFPQTVRSNLQMPFSTYFSFGHDEAASVANDPKSPENCIKIEKLEGSLNVLFGGIGDGRHFWATLFDVHKQWVNLKDSDKSKFSFKALFNDINAHVLVLNVLILVLTYEIGKRKTDYKSLLRTDADAYFMTLVLYYTSLSYAMPGIVYDKLKEYLGQIFDSKEEFRKQYPWIEINNEVWTKLKHVAGYWEDSSKYEPSLPSVKQVLDYHVPRLEAKDDKELFSVMEKLHGTETASEIVKDYKLSRERLLEDAREYAASHPNSIPQIKGDIPNISDKEAVQFLGYILCEETYLSEHTFVEDKDFIRKTNALGAFNEESPVKALNKMFKKGKCNFKDWNVNVGRYDPLWWKYAGQREISDNTNPINDWIRFFFKLSMRENMSLLYMDPFLTDLSLFQAFAFFHLNAGKALIELLEADKVLIEFSLCSVIDVPQILHQKEERKKANLPIKFNRVLLSNIPDYIGLLSCFLSLMPLMKNEVSVPAGFRMNSLVNQSVWKSYNEYCFSTTGLELSDIQKVLGLKLYNAAKVEVDTSFHHWFHEGSGKHFNRDELRLWLQRVYLMSILPPERVANTDIVERRPNTVETFLQLCSFCIEHLKYPLHWVTGVIEELLKNPVLKTNISIENRSPATPVKAKTKEKNVFHLKPFQTELRNSIAIFQRSGLLTNEFLIGNSLPSGMVQTYTLKLEGFEPLINGNHNTSCLGFLLKKKSDDKFKVKDLISLIKVMDSATSSPPKLSTQLRNGTSKNIHVFSTGIFENKLKEFKFSFRMCEDIFNKYRDYFFTVIRTDCWTEVQHNELRLRDATSVL